MASSAAAPPLASRVFCHQFIDSRSGGGTLGADGGRDERGNEEEEGEMQVHWNRKMGANVFAAKRYANAMPEAGDHSELFGRTRVTTKRENRLTSFVSRMRDSASSGRCHCKPEITTGGNVELNAGSTCGSQSSSLASRVWGPFPLRVRQQKGVIRRSRARSLTRPATRQIRRRGAPYFSRYSRTNCTVA